MGKALRNAAARILRAVRSSPQGDNPRGRSSKSAWPEQRRKSAPPERQLKDLISIGPAMLRDFEMLGIRSVPQLAGRNPRKMYERLELQTGQRQDPCVLDTFCAAVAQARNPRLPAEQCEWWWWSRKRKKS